MIGENPSESFHWTGTAVSAPAASVTKLPEAFERPLPLLGAKTIVMAPLLNTNVNNTTSTATGLRRRRSTTVVQHESDSQIAFAQGVTRLSRVSLPEWWLMSLPERNV
jgi:hypothetical protein